MDSDNEGRKKIAFDEAGYIKLIDNEEQKTLKL